MKRVFAIIPVKPLDEGKSRLRAILGPSERIRINSLLFARTLDRAAVFPGASRSIVVSRSADVLAQARARGMIALPETHADLNTALADATRAAVEQSATGVLIMPADLPFARAEALSRIVETHPEAPGCVIVPDRHRCGTNLLYVAPPADTIYRFGEDSCAKHRIAAAERGYRVSIVEDDQLAFDIDEPADYDLWRSREGGSR